MGREPIENEYFNWLCAKVLDGVQRSYYTLLGILHSTEFIWVLPVSGDEHRIEDALELRGEFLRARFVKNDPVWRNQPVSVLEVLIALAQRAQFQTDIPVAEWFWIFMENLQLDQYRQVSDNDVRDIDAKIYTFIWRTYDEFGNGGLFPMTQTQRDQREVELLYQLFEYIHDRGLV